MRGVRQVSDIIRNAMFRDRFGAPLPGSSVPTAVRPTIMQT